MFEPSVIVAYESVSCSQCKKDGSQNHTVIVGKGSNTQNCLKNQRICGT